MPLVVQPCPKIGVNKLDYIPYVTQPKQSYKKNNSEKGNSE